MSESSRANRLLQQPDLARLIQIASLVKQAISADEVIILRPLQMQDSALSIVWYDGLRKEPVSPSGAVSLKSHRLLTQDQLKALAASQLDRKHLAVHYLQDGYLWPEYEVDSGEVQAIRMIYFLDDQCYLIVWARDQACLFTKSDYESFVQLCDAISQSDEELLDGKPFQFPRSKARPGHQPADMAESDLTPMEIKVLQLLKGGLTEKAVALRLHRSRHTIHVHVRSIYRKLMVNSRSELINKMCGEDSLR